MRMMVLPVAFAVIAALMMPADAHAEEPTPAMRAWMKAVSHRLQSEGFSVRSSRVDAEGLTVEATFRRRGEAYPALTSDDERRSVESR